MFSTFMGLLVFLLAQAAFPLLVIYDVYTAVFSE